VKYPLLLPAVVALVFSGLVTPLLAEESVPCPFAPPEAEAVQRLIERSGMDVVTTDKPFFPHGSMKQRLESLGIETGGMKAWGFHKAEGKAAFLAFIYDENGHVYGISGNGPWLPNDSIRDLVAMPELRIIRLDHNVRPDLGWEHPDYHGTGFDALRDSKLADVKIGHGFNDAGLMEVAQIPTLQHLAVGHSRITEAGVEALRGHPGLVSLSIGEMGNLPAGILAIYATIPNLREAGINETFLTYTDGFDHLRPLAGQLEKIDLQMSICTPDDLAKLKADHPEAEILMLEPAEIVKLHSWVANRILEKASREAGAPLAAALIEADKLDKRANAQWVQEE